MGQSAGNDTDVVDQAGEGGNEKSLLCKLHRHEQATSEKEKLGRQDDAGHFQDRGDFRGKRFARCKQMKEGQGERFAGDDQPQQQDSGAGQNNGKDFPPLFIPVLDQIFREDGDEGDGEKPAGNQMV